jgi:hypothetical protein
MSEFKYGDMVEVRNLEDQRWGRPRFYLGAIPFPNGELCHYTMKMDEDESNFDGIAINWRQVRKPELTIEELWLTRPPSQNFRIHE